MRKEPLLNIIGDYEGVPVVVLEVNGKQPQDYHEHNLLDNESNIIDTKLAKGKAIHTIVLGTVTNEFMKKYPTGTLTIHIDAVGDGRKRTFTKTAKIS